MKQKTGKRKRKHGSETHTTFDGKHYPKYTCHACGYLSEMSYTENPICSVCGDWRSEIHKIAYANSKNQKEFLNKLKKSNNRPVFPCNPYYEDLAKRDGFEDDTIEDSYNYMKQRCEEGFPHEGLPEPKTAAEKMFEWFDEHYDLSEPKVLQVIRWVRK